MIYNLKDLNKKSIEVSEDIYNSLVENETHLGAMGIRLEEEDFKDDLHCDFIHVYSGNSGVILIKESDWLFRFHAEEDINALLRMELDNEPISREKAEEIMGAILEEEHPEFESFLFESEEESVDYTYDIRYNVEGTSDILFLRYHV